jgi:hypothetical protein
MRLLLARIQIAIEAGTITAGTLPVKFMSGAENIARGP